jgi:hypothetical protein
MAFGDCILGVVPNHTKSVFMERSEFTSSWRVLAQALVKLGAIGGARVERHPYGVGAYVEGELGGSWPTLDFRFS